MEELFKFFSFLISTQEEVQYSEEENEDEDKDIQFDDDVAFISNDGLDGGEVIIEPSFVNN